LTNKDLPCFISNGNERRNVVHSRVLAGCEVGKHSKLRAREPPFAGQPKQVDSNISTYSRLYLPARNKAESDEYRPLAQPYRQE